MSDPFFAEIRMFGGTFAPRNWAFCTGQLLPISQSSALFSLLGTTYGGNGKTTFGLPDLRDRTPMGWGQGPGLSNRTIGEVTGAETVTLVPTEMPSHGHLLQATAGDGSTSDPSGALLADATESAYAVPGALEPMGVSSLAPSGGGQPHPNRQPSLGIQFIIALQGIYPSRP